METRRGFLQQVAALGFAARSSSGVAIAKNGDDRISVEIDGQAFTELYTHAEGRKPYLWPLRSATGKVVTRGYPMQEVAGENHDHPHHRGLWFAHGDVNGYNFWAGEKSQLDDKTGSITLVKIDGITNGKDSGSADVRFDWNDPGGKPLLIETRKMVFYSNPSLRVIDFDIGLKAVEQAKFGDTKEGTFAIRLASELEEEQPKNIASPKRTGKMVNAQGQPGEKLVWGKRSEWVDYFGKVGGEPVGIAILDHPGNPRHPTYWHSRAYGLFAANIFGVHDFTNDKTADGSMTLNPGQSIRFRYRVLIHPGDYRTANVVRLYQDYASGKQPGAAR